MHHFEQLLQLTKKRLQAARTRAMQGWAVMRNHARGFRWPPTWLDAMLAVGFIACIAFALYNLLPCYTPIVRGGTMSGLATPWLYRVVEGIMALGWASAFLVGYLFGKDLGDVLERYLGAE